MKPPSRDFDREFLIRLAPIWLVERRPRLQCGGNGVVPLQCAAVLTVLARRLGIA